MTDFANTTTTTAAASKAHIRNWAKPSPKPSDEASQASPRPAASPPNMPPQARLGAAAALATELDGVELACADHVPLTDDGATHRVRVLVPRS